MNRCRGCGSCLRGVAFLEEVLAVALEGCGIFACIVLEGCGICLPAVFWRGVAFRRVLSVL